MRALIDFPDTAPQAVPGGRLCASFGDPIEVIEAWAMAEVLPALERVQGIATGAFAEELSATLQAVAVLSPPAP
mgnify:CR=1 FL=1